MQEAVVLDPHQRAAWDDIRRGFNVLVTGPAGTGKSALLQHVVEQLEAEGIPYALAAMTGQAAELIGGTTLHSCFGWSKHQAVKDFEISEKRRRWLRRLRVLIIDECSMLSAEFLQYLVEAVTRMRTEESLQEAAETQQAPQRQQQKAAPLAGLQLVLVGDFHQLPPVVKTREFKAQQEAAGIALTRALRNASIEGGSLEPQRIKQLAPFLNRGLAFESAVWQELGMRVHQLSQVHRQRDAHFVRTLHAIRAGRQTPAQLAELRSLSRPLDASDGILPTELHSTNEAADNINRRELERLEDATVVYTSIDTVAPKAYMGDGEGDVEERRQQLEHMMLRVLSDDRKIAQTLELKLGAQVMLCVNLSRDPYLVNGSRGVVVGYVGGDQEEALLQAELHRLQSLLHFEQDLEMHTQPVQRTPGAGRRSTRSPQQQLQPPQQEQQQQARSQSTQQAGLQPTQAAAALSCPVDGGPPPLANISTAPGSPSVVSGSGSLAGNIRLGGGGGGSQRKSGLSQLMLTQHRRRQDPQQQQQSQSQGHSKGHQVQQHSQQQLPSQHHFQQHQHHQQPASSAAGSQGCSSSQQSPAAPSPSLQRLQCLRLSTPGGNTGTPSAHASPAASGPAGPAVAAWGAGAGPAAAAAGLAGNSGISPYKRRLDLDFEHAQQQRRPRLAGDAPVLPTQLSVGAVPQPANSQQRHVQQQQPQLEGLGEQQEVQQQCLVKEEEQQWDSVLLYGPTQQLTQPDASGAMPSLTSPAAQNGEQHKQALDGQPPPPPQQQAPSGKAAVAQEPEVVDLVSDSEEDDGIRIGPAGGGGSGGWDGGGRGASDGNGAADLFGGLDAHQQEEEAELGYLPSPYGGEALLAQLSKVRADLVALRAMKEQAQGTPVLLPLVKFRSCAKPVCIKPHLFDHKIRNIGVICRVQLPLMLAWAMTIHKAQGASLDKVVVDVSRCFAEGQVYVALSRGRSMEGLCIRNLAPSKIKTNAAATRFYARGGAPLPPHQVLRFPARDDVPPEFYRAMQAGQPLALAQVPHLVGGHPAAAAGGVIQGHSWQQQQQQQPVTPVGRGGTPRPPSAPFVAGGDAMGVDAGALRSPAAVPLPQLVPVSMQLAGDDGTIRSNGGGNGNSNGGSNGNNGSRRGDAVVLGRAWLRHQAADVAGLLRLLCSRDMLDAPLGAQFDLYCTMEPGGPLMRVAATAVQLEELLAGAHTLVMRQRQ